MAAVFRVLFSFFDSGSFAGETTQVEEFCTTNDTVALYFDLFQTWGMNEECSFYADAVGNTTNGEGFSYAGISSSNDNAFENLNSFVLAFYDFNMNSYGVPGTEFRNVVSQLFIFQCFNNIHDLFLLSHRTFMPIAGGRGLSRLTLELYHTSFSIARKKFSNDRPVYCTTGGWDFKGNQVYRFKVLGSRFEGRGGAQVKKRRTTTRTLNLRTSNPYC